MPVWKQNTQCQVEDTKLTMGSTQLYSLTWGEFGTSLVSAVQLLRCHGDLVDVTLAAGGRSFPAHKIVLCAASPFLLNLLKTRVGHGGFDCLASMFTLSEPTSFSSYGNASNKTICYWKYKTLMI